MTAQHPFSGIFIIALPLILSLSPLTARKDYRSALSAKEANAWIKHFLRRAPRRVVKRFHPGGPKSGRTLLAISYKDQIFDRRGFAKFRGIIQPVERITYVYSNCLRSNQLKVFVRNKRNLNALQYSAPGLFTDPMIRWDILEQRDCTGEGDAAKLFHGFIITTFTRPDPKERENDKKIFTDLLAGKEITPHRPGDQYNPRHNTVTRVLTRNTTWNHMLIVSDLTGSMGPYVGRLLLWQKQNAHLKRAKHFVFFNDGDKKKSSEKKAGVTGGIYQTGAENLNDIIKRAIEATAGGTGGDLQENDVEALLKGVQACPACQSLVLVADLRSPMRDFKLHSRILKPVKIILCGKGRTINLEYLDLARNSGGSLHTYDKDFTSIASMQENDTINIMGYTYMVRGGAFIRLRR